MQTTAGALDMPLKARIMAMVGGFVVIALLLMVYGLSTLADYRRMMTDYGRAYENAYMGEKLNHLISNAVMESRGIYLAQGPQEMQRFVQSLKDNLAEIHLVINQWQAEKPTHDLTPIIQQTGRFIAERNEIIRLSETISPAAAETYGLTIRNNRIAFQAEIDKLVAATRADLAVAKAKSEAFNQQRIAGFAVVVLVGVAGVTLLSLWLVRHFITRELERGQEAQDAREKLLKELTASNTELERFAYVASHDMQEPVRIVSIFSQMVAMDYADKLDDKGKQYLGIIRDSSQQMLMLVQDLLNYSRLEPEDEVHETVDMDEQLKHVRANLGQLIQTTGARIESSDLPKLTANPIQIQRLLQNLVANAIKYQPEDQTPVVWISAEDKPDHWQISVKDNGLGVAPEYATQIFEPFRRLHTWDKIQGTGLGLSICRKIVEHHGGRIWVDSIAGEGSTFHFTIIKPAARPVHETIANLRASAMLSVA